MNTPVRRITIPTAKMEESIAFYGDVFGMKVFYDQIMEGKDAILLGPEGMGKHRLVSLQQAESQIGMIGLMEYITPKADVKPFAQPEGGAYPVIFVIMVDDMKDIEAKVRKAGYKIVGGPLAYEIPERGTAIGMTCLDPNGVVLDLTQLPSRDPSQTGAVSPLRRITFPIARGKMAATIKFYEEALEMSVFYNQKITQEKSLLGIPGVNKTHVVSLRQGDSNFGMVGLLEFLEPEVTIKPFSKRDRYPFEAILVFLVDDADAVIAKATANGGTVFGRKVYEIPQRGQAIGVMIADPNGVMVELTQWVK